MRYRIVTSFSNEGWDLYGRAMVESFKEFWPSEASLIVAWEDYPPGVGINGFDLFSTEPARSWYTRHRDDPIIAGRKPHPKWPWGKKWKDYNYKFDAYKFAHKVFAIGATARYVEDGKLFWLDGDTITHKPIPTEFLDEILPDDVALSYLPRPNWTHSECGFIGFNLEKMEARSFIRAFEDIYGSDRFIDVPCWHDSFVFDYLVSKRSPKFFHLKSDSVAQPFDHSVLGKYMTHFKGARKTGAPGWAHEAVR